MIRRGIVLLALALRNLRRQARRSLLTALAMIIGGMLLMISLPLGDGTHEDWIESAVRMGSGHLAIQAPGYQTSRKIADRISASARTIAETALSQPGIVEHLVDIVPRLETVGLASSPTGARPAQIVGVDPEAESRFSILDDKLIEGRYLEPDDRLAAYVGAGLVESLELRLGSRVVLTAQDGDGEIAGQLVRVVGIFRTGIPEADQGLIHIPAKTAGSWLSVGDDVTTIALLLDSSNRVPSFGRALRRELAGAIDDASLTVLGWRQAMPQLDAAVKIDDLGNYMFQFILFGIIGLGIVNTVLMAVMYRRREFALLQALGLTPQQTGSLVMLEGIVLTAISGVIGIGLGLFITWFFWRDGLDLSFAWGEDFNFAGVVIDPVVFPYFRVARVAQGLVFILLIGMLASVYPAIRATRIDVAESMKFER